MSKKQLERVRGWVGIELDRINDQDLTYHIEVAWELIAPKRLLAMVRTDDSSKEQNKGEITK